jgi:hypothetical protein
MPWYGLQSMHIAKRQLFGTNQQSAPVGKRGRVEFRPLLTQFIIRIKWLKYNYRAHRARVAPFHVTERHASRSNAARQLYVVGSDGLGMDMQQALFADYGRYIAC